MCQTSINLISKALDDVDNAEVLLKIKGVVALFIQTMDVSLKNHVLIIQSLTHVYLGLGILRDSAGYFLAYPFRKIRRIIEKTLQ